jgi:hypothetical protein
VGEHADPIIGDTGPVPGNEHFQATYVLVEPTMRIILSTGLVVSQNVGYLSDGLYPQGNVSVISPEGAIELDVKSVFHDGAPECP